MSTTRAILQPYLLAFFCIDREARQLAIEISLKVFFGTAKLQTVLFLNQYRAVKAEQHPTLRKQRGETQSRKEELQGNNTLC